MTVVGLPIVSNLITCNKVQYEAAKIVSGATHGTSTTLLLQDLGWESLSSRREDTNSVSSMNYIMVTSPLI